MFEKIKGLLTIEIDQKRTYGLDILRAFAILSVLLGHMNTLFPEKIKKILDFFVVDGVGIFFVLSGFLIGGILIKTIENKGFDRKILLDFWIRRWFRTLPAYFLVLTFLVVLYTVFNAKDFGFNIYGKYFIFSQNLMQSHPDFFPEAWSLSVEEWFYIITPLLILGLVFLNISKKSSVLLSCILIIVGVTFFRIWTYYNVDILTNDEFGQIVKKRVFMRLDALMYGVFAAYLNYYYNHKFLAFKEIKLIIGLFLLVFGNIYIPDLVGFYRIVFSFSINSLATFLILPYLYSLKSGKGKVFSLITYLSLVSYSMYLLNYSFILNLLIGSVIPWRLITDNSNLLIVYKVIVFWGVLIVLSILLYKYFEIPMMKLRDNKKIKKILKLE